ncbi:MAG TPA: hypothetical protein VMU24_04425 [Candidatus Acidoferrales bacterium]|nr:hypothetical protein [Candidatus Acidoferrales bacterium]
MRFFLLLGAFAVVIRFLGLLTSEQRDERNVREHFLTGIGLAFLIGLMIFAWMVKRI